MEILNFDTTRYIVNEKRGRFSDREIIINTHCPERRCSEQVQTSNKEEKASRLSTCLLVWGCGEFGQHGYGHNDDVTLEKSLCEIKEERFLLNGQSPRLTVSGSSHTLVLTEHNILYSWGNGISGQLGNNTIQTVYKPKQVILEANAKIAGLSCGARHSFIWTTDGQCYSFGNNFNAQLGFNFSKPDFKDNQLKPVLVEFFPGVSVKEVACGARHTLFLLTTGNVMAVGCNQQGQIGNGTTDEVVIPIKVEDLTAITHIACGNSHSLAADENGGLYGWGYGKALGTKTRHISSPKMFHQDSNYAVLSLVGGDSHSMVLYENGCLFTWGNNYEGQLGLGNLTKYKTEPELIPEELLPRPVHQISCGETTCTAVTGDGKLYMWGKNAGLIHLDKSSQYFQFEPLYIETGHRPVKQVSCGAWHVSAIVDNCKNLDTVITATRSTENQAFSGITETQIESTGHVIDEGNMECNVVEKYVKTEEKVPVSTTDEHTTQCTKLEDNTFAAKLDVINNLNNDNASNTHPHGNVTNRTECDTNTENNATSVCHYLDNNFNVAETRSVHILNSNPHTADDKIRNRLVELLDKPVKNKLAPMSKKQVKEIRKLGNHIQDTNPINHSTSVQPGNNKDDNFHIIEKGSIQINKSSLHEHSEEMSSLPKNRENTTNIITTHKEEKRKPCVLLRNNTMPEISRNTQQTRCEMLRPQTVPVINLDFQNTPRTTSVLKDNHTKNQKTNFGGNFRSLWKSTSLFREKQSKALNRQKKPQQEVNFVCNLEHMLPNRPINVVSETKKVTQDMSPAKLQGTRQKLQFNQTCPEHSGELLPAICSCEKKNSKLIKSKQGNVFIERKLTY